MNPFLCSPLGATLVCGIWPFVFCYIWLYQVSWNLLRIPVGLAIIGVPFYMMPPLVLLAGVYEFALAPLAKWLHRPEMSVSFAWRIGLPCFVISVLMCLFYPLEAKEDYLVYFFLRITGRK